jgi:hypothetical protein
MDNDDFWWHQQDQELMQLEHAAKQLYVLYLYLLLGQRNFSVEGAT